MCFPARRRSLASHTQLGEFKGEADVMKAHRRRTVEKRFAKVKQTLSKEREHRLEDLKVLVESCSFFHAFITSLAFV